MALRLVMITAVQDVHVATNAFRNGAIDYLLKPFARGQLESVVTRAMDHGRLMKQNRGLPTESGEHRVFAHRAAARDVGRS